MSWHYLPELAGDCSAVDCSAGAPSARSRSTTTVSGSCSSDSETAASKSFRSGTTCEPSAGMSGAVESMSLPPGFLASLSVAPVSEGEQPTNETCGRQPHEYLAKYDHATHCWRTCQRSLLADTLVEFSETWPRWGLMRDGVCFLQAPLEHILRGGDYGSLPRIPRPVA